MSITGANDELRIQIGSEFSSELQDSNKDVTNSGETNNHDIAQVFAVQSVPEHSSALPTLQQSTQFVNLPPDPPPYSEFPIYTIPLSNRQGRTIYDPPPPYDPTMSREGLDSLDFPYQNYQRSSSSRFECKPDTLVPLGFCYCTLEQLIVTMAILGTFLFLGLGQLS